MIYVIDYTDDESYQYNKTIPELRNPTIIKSMHLFKSSVYPQFSETLTNLLR